MAGVENAIPGTGGVVERTSKALCGSPAELVGREVGSGLGGANDTREGTAVGWKAGGVATD